jgi:hypothetical protein
MPFPVVAVAVATTIASLGTVVGVEAVDGPASPSPRAWSGPCASGNGWTGWCLDDGDGCAVDAWIADTNGNGWADVFWFDLDVAADGPDCTMDTYVVDPNEQDGLIAKAWFNLDENQVWDRTVSQAFSPEGWVETTTCQDTNGNGPDDEVCWTNTTTTVGAPSYDGVAGLLVGVSALSGAVVG